MRLQCQECGCWWESRRNYKRTQCDACWQARKAHKTARAWDKWNARRGLWHGKPIAERQTPNACERSEQ